MNGVDNKNLNKSYRTRYNVSLLENSTNIKEKGIEKFLEDDKIKWTCDKCGSIKGVD